VSVEDVPLADVSLFPIPAHTLLTLESSGLQFPLTIAIFDLTGKQIFSLESSSERTELDLQGRMSPGIYLIGVSDRNRTVRKTLLIH
jgi:hypothetical protein